MKHCNKHNHGRCRTVEIGVDEYADLLLCKHKLMFIGEINALRETVKELEAMNARLLAEKYKDLDICNILKGEGEKSESF